MKLNNQYCACENPDIWATETDLLRGHRNGDTIFFKSKGPAGGIENVRCEICQKPPHPSLNYDFV